MATPPKWFEEWESNHFKSLARDVLWVKWITLALVASVVMAAVTRLI